MKKEMPACPVETTLMLKYSLRASLTAHFTLW